MGNCCPKEKKQKADDREQTRDRWTRRLAKSLKLGKRTPTVDVAALVLNSGTQWIDNISFYKFHDMTPQSSLISMFDNEEMSRGASDCQPTNMFIHSATALHLSETSILIDMFDNEAETGEDLEALASDTRHPSFQHPSSANQQLMEDVPVGKLLLESPHIREFFPSCQENSYKEFSGTDEPIEEYIETDNKEEVEDLDKEIPYYSLNLKKLSVEGRDVVMLNIGEDKQLKNRVEYSSDVVKKVETTDSLNKDESIKAYKDDIINVEKKVIDSNLVTFEQMADGKKDKVLGDEKKKDTMGVEKRNEDLVVEDKNTKLMVWKNGKVKTGKTKKEKNNTSKGEEMNENVLPLGAGGSDVAPTDRKLYNTSQETKSSESTVSLSISESLGKIINHNTKSDCLMTLCVRSPIAGPEPRQIQVRATSKQAENGTAKRVILTSKCVTSQQTPIGPLMLQKKKSKRHINILPAIAIQPESKKITWTQKKGSRRLTELHTIPCFYEPPPKQSNPRERMGLTRLQKYNIKVQPKAIERIKMDEDDFPGILPPNVKEKWKRMKQERNKTSVD